MGYKGMCSECTLAVTKKDDPRKHKICLKYGNTCMSVARNCHGPMNGIMKVNWKDYISHDARGKYESVL